MVHVRRKLEDEGNNFEVRSDDAAKDNISGLF